MRARFNMLSKRRVRPRIGSEIQQEVGKIGRFFLIGACGFGSEPRILRAFAPSRLPVKILGSDLRTHSARAGFPERARARLGFVRRASLRLDARSRSAAGYRR